MDAKLTERLDSPFAMYKTEKQSVRKTYLPVLDRCMDIAKKYTGLIFETPLQGALQTQLARDLAYVYLYSGQVKKSKEFFQLCIEATRVAEEGGWPSSELALNLLLGLASCQAQLGNEAEAREALETSLTLAEKLFDNFDDRTAEISSRLKRLKERQEVNVGHHKAALVASTGRSAVKRPPAERSPSPPEALETLRRPERGSYHNANSTSENVGRSAQEQQDGAISRSLNHQTPPWPFRPLVKESNKQSWDCFRDWLKDYDDVDINIPWQGKSLLMWLLGNDSSTAARVLLEERCNDIDVNLQDSEGCTALHYALDHKHNIIINLLVQSFGVDVNQPNGRGEAPIIRAVNSGAKKQFTILRELGADLGGTLDASGWTPRLAAAVYGWYGNPEIASEFKYVDPNRLDDKGRTALHVTLVEELPIRHFKALLRWGVDVNARDRVGRSVLHYACKRFYFDEELSLDYLKFMVTEVDGVDVNLQDNDGMTPLMVACECNDRASVKVQLGCAGDRLNFELRCKRGDNVIDVGKEVRRTAQFLAIQHKAVDVVAEMVKRGFLDPRHEDEAEGMNAVLFAAHFDSRLCLEYLVKVSPEAVREALLSRCPTREGTIERLREAIEKPTVTARIDDPLRELAESTETMPGETEDLPSKVGAERGAGKTDKLLKWVGKWPGKYRAG